MHTTTEIKIGTRVRCFEFAGVRNIVGDAADFIEGVVVSMPVIAGTLKYQVQVDRVVRHGLECPVILDTEFVVANGVELAIGKVADFVVPVNAPVTIQIVRRSDDYMARTADNHGVWGRGVTVKEAVGDLILSFPERFGIKIEG